jgi:hypothetical protein
MRSAMLKAQCVMPNVYRLMPKDAAEGGMPNAECRVLNAEGFEVSEVRVHGQIFTEIHTDIPVFMYSALFRRAGAWLLPGGSARRFSHLLFPQRS